MAVRERKTEGRPGLALAGALLALGAMGAGAIWPAETWIWPATRSVLFLLVGFASRQVAAWTVTAWAVACVLVAWQGWAGLDWALALLLGVELRLSRNAIVGLGLGVALSAVVALLWQREAGPLPLPIAITSRCLSRSCCRSWPGGHCGTTTRRRCLRP